MAALQRGDGGAELELAYKREFEVYPRFEGRLVSIEELIIHDMRAHLAAFLRLRPAADINEAGAFFKFMVRRIIPKYKASPNPYTQALAIINNPESFPGELDAKIDLVMKVLFDAFMRNRQGCLSYLRSATSFEHIIALLPSNRIEGMQAIIRRDIERMSKGGAQGMTVEQKQYVLRNLGRELEMLPRAHARGLAHFQQHEAEYSQPQPTRQVRSPAPAPENEIDFIIASAGPTRDTATPTAAAPAQLPPEAKRERRARAEQAVQKLQVLVAAADAALNKALEAKELLRRELNEKEQRLQNTNWGEKKFWLIPVHSQEEKEALEDACRRLDYEIKDADSKINQEIARAGKEREQAAYALKKAQAKLEAIEEELPFTDAGILIKEDAPWAIIGDAGSNIYGAWGREIEGGFAALIKFYVDLAQQKNEIEQPIGVVDRNYRLDWINAIAHELNKRGKFRYEAGSKMVRHATVSGSFMTEEIICVKVIPIGAFVEEPPAAAVSAAAPVPASATPPAAVSAPAPTAGDTDKSVAAPADAGGINFTALPAVIQPAPGSPSSLAPHPSLLSERVASLPSLDSEWQQIQRMLSGGIIPSNQRLKEYLMRVCTNENCQQELDKVLSCIADILRMEEERCCDTETSLRQMLILLEQDKPAQELQLALAQIQVGEKEPQVIEAE
jgi:hypothetical protein